jgi:hypothetical protein
MDSDNWGEEEWSNNEEGYENGSDWSDVPEADDVDEEPIVVQKSEQITFDYIEKKYQFGEKAFENIKNETVEIRKYESDTTFIKPLFTNTISGFMKLRGQRGQHTILAMILACYSQGLFTLGESINKQIIPALQYVLNEMNKLKKDDSKRKSVLRSLTDAFLDCQQVQAREILRIFGDLTNQTQTLDKQIAYMLTRQKEQSLNEFISMFHIECDLDHTKSSPSQQRAHLYSAYLDMIGEYMGMDGVEAARDDRFLGETVNEIRKGVWVGVGRETILKAVKNRLSLKQFVQCVLADINCQSDNADRLIDRDSIFKWAEKNMSLKKTDIFYNDENEEKYKHQEPQKPVDKNKYQPFLSIKLLVEILEKMELIKRK